MASLLFAAGVLSYDQIKKQTQKRRAKKAHSNTRFSELERDNAARISNLQGTTCFCQQSDWQGGGCEAHGYVPAAGEPGGPPLYTEHAPSVHETPGGYGPMPGLGRRASEPPVYQENGDGVGSTSPETQARSVGSGQSPYQYRRGQEDGFLAAPSGGQWASHSAVDLREGRAPPPMGDEEVRRINEERRKGMKAGGFTNFVLRWKKDKTVVKGE